MAISEKVLSAALAGPEVKEAKINEPSSSKSHEFNIKPVSYRIHKNEVTIFGQISHCLRAREDDQVWFTFKKTGSTVTPGDSSKMVVEKQEGGIIKTIKRLKPVGVAIGAYFGFDAGKYFDMVSDHEKDLSFVDFDGDWEKAAGYFMEELARRATAPKGVKVSGLRLYEHDNMRGKSTTIQVGKNVSNAKSIGWNDKASSLMANVPEGKKLEIFQHDNYEGRVLELGPGIHIIRDLKIHKMGDEITSVRWENA